MIRQHNITVSAEQAAKIPARICLEPGCGKRLRSDNKSDYCTQHHHIKNRPSVEQKVCQRNSCGKPLRSDNTTGYCPEHLYDSKRRTVVTEPEELVTLEDLDACRKDPAWEKHQGMTDQVVVCRVCGARVKMPMRMRDRKGHLWAKHRMRTAEYLALYPNAPLYPPKRCIGMVVADSDHVLVQCPEVFTPAHADQQYHSPDCQQWTGNRQQLGYQLGAVYVEGQHTKRHPPKLCQKGWAIRDGVIAPCAEPFTPDRTDQEYHSNVCYHRTRRWQKLGFKLGMSVLRTCAYRKCKKGDGGTRNTFVPKHLSLRIGDRFCDQCCRAAEQRACEADSIAEKLAAGEQFKMRLELERQGPVGMVRNEVADAIGNLRKLFSLPQLKQHPYLLLQDGWTCPGFSQQEIKAAKQAILRNARPGNRPSCAAICLVAAERHMSFETVRDYCKR